VSQRTFADDLQYDANGTMLTETATGTTTTIHNDATTSTPIVENLGSTTTTAYVLDGNGTPIEGAQGSTALLSDRRSQG
jgi:hypothetical protein